MRDLLLSLLIIKNVNQTLNSNFCVNRVSDPAGCSPWPNLDEPLRLAGSKRIALRSIFLHGLRQPSHFPHDANEHQHKVWVLRPRLLAEWSRRICADRPSCRRRRPLNSFPHLPSANNSNLVLPLLVLSFLKCFDKNFRFIKCPVWWCLHLCLYRHLLLSRSLLP